MKKISVGAAVFCGLVAIGQYIDHHPILGLVNAIFCAINAGLASE